MKIVSLSETNKRKENQDNFWSAVLDVDGKESVVVCLCDGMGGLTNGGLASKMVVEAVRDSILSGMQFEEMASVISQVNLNIHELAKEDNQQMGTTCTILECHNGIYKIAHVGDSRCYMLRGGSYYPLTVDHSALQKYGITKEKSPDLWKKYKNSLTRCIGVKSEVQVDTYDGEYQSGDRFLLCSDGLWHTVEDGVDIRLFSNISTLVQECVRSGETDNITGCLVEV